MKRRDMLFNTVKGTSIAMLGAADRVEAAPAQSSGENLPNILHIFADQQIWDSIADRSVCRTPNINRLAREGMLFNRSYTPCPLCCPARAMLLTGAYHWHNGVFNQVHSAPSVSRDMHEDVVTYSMKLKEKGYRTGYVGKWHASFTRTPYDFGYDEMGAPNAYNTDLLDHLRYYDSRVKGEAAGFELGANAMKKTMKTVVSTRKFQWPGCEPFTMWGHVEGDEENTNLYGTFETGIRMMRRFSAEDQPWLLEIHTIEPHDPYMPLKRCLDHYDPESIPVPASFYDTFEGKPGMHRRESESWGAVTEQDYQQGRAHYYAYCEMVDAEVGRVLAELDNLGEAENTIVVFTSDHGDMVGSHRMWIKGWQPYEECHRVPMVVRWPGRIKAGSICDHLVQTHDLAHTYVEIAEAGEMPFNDGDSLVPLFENPRRTDWKDHILNTFYGGEFLYTQRMVITDSHKYVFNGFDIDECYDLENDPHELRNIVGDKGSAAVVDDLRARMYELMARYEDPFGDVANSADIGQAPGRYGAPRYLGRGKRLS